MKSSTILRKLIFPATTLGLFIMATSARISTHSISPGQMTPTSIPLNSVTWTPIGPAPSVNGACLGVDCTPYTENTSGRIAALAAHPTNANIIYIAAASGGVWKTTNALDPVPANVKWTPLTDTQSTLFMGAIALAPSDPETIYAGTGEAVFGPGKARNLRDNIYYGRGILKSTNGGNSWTLLGNAQFDRRAISKIVVHPTNPLLVYVAVGAQPVNGLPGNTGIWKSDDGGNNWALTTSAISTTAAFSDLLIDPLNSQTLYAAVGEPGGHVANGVYKSTDAGATWSVAGNFPTGAVDPSIGRIKLAISSTPAPAPQVVYASVATVAQENPDGSIVDPRLYRMLKSADGNTWTDLVLPSTTLCISGHRPDGTEIRTNLFGINGDYHSTLAVDPSNPDVLYAGGICLAVSTDGGSTSAGWVAIAQGDTDGPHRDHHGIGFDANGRLLDGNDGGLWRLNDLDLQSWANLNGNLQITQFVGIALHPDPTNADFAFGGTQDNGSARFKGVAQWERVLRGDGGASGVVVATIDGVRADRIYQVTRITLSGAVFRRSDDGGDSWLIRDGGETGGIRGAPMNFYPPFAMDPRNSDRLVFGTNQVWQTIDAANAWSPISTPGMAGWTDNRPIDSLAIAAQDGNTIYAATGGHVRNSVAHVFVTLDNGATWQQRDIAGASDHLHELIVDPDNKMIAYAVRDRFGGGHVFRTTTGGASWNDISGNLPDLPTYSIALDPTTNPPTLFIGNDNGVFASSNLGQSWSRYKAGLPNVQVVSLKLNTSLNILAAGTYGRGVWEVLLR